MSVTEEIVVLEESIKVALSQALSVRSRVMREQEDIHPSSPIALMELSVRSLGHANDAARYARHALGGPMPGSKGYIGAVKESE